MSQQNPIQDLTFEAEVDLSLDDAKATSLRYRALKSGSAEDLVTSIAADTDRVIGVQTNLPELGDLVALAVLGTTKVRAGAVVAAWDYLQLDAVGKFITGGGGGDRNWAIALEAAAADGDIIEAILIGLVVT